MSFVRLAKRGFDQMNELDVVRVKETVMATPTIDDLPIEIIAGWAGTIVACADTHAPHGGIYRISRRAGNRRSYESGGSPGHPALKPIGLNRALVPMLDPPQYFGPPPRGRVSRFVIQKNPALP